MRRLVVLTVAAAAPYCACTPTRISEDIFPAQVRTCYEFPAPLDAGGDQTSFNGGLIRPEGCEQDGMQSTPSTSTGGGSAPAAIASAMDAGGTVQLTPQPSNDDAGTDAPATERSDAGTGTEPSHPTMALPDGCEARVLELFKSPFNAMGGGCQPKPGSAGGCHEPGTGNSPDLASDGVGTRLLGGRTPDPLPDDYQCLDVADRVWIVAGGSEAQSLLWRKLNSDFEGVLFAKPPCGDSMPAFPAKASDIAGADRECVRQWIRFVAKSPE